MPVVFGYINDAERVAGPRNQDISVTAPQVEGMQGAHADNQLYARYQQYYRTYMAMRSDPTIAFARMLCIAPLVNAGWDYNELKGAPEGAKAFIEKAIEPHRMKLIKTAMEGHIDFGWQPYEVIKTIDDDGNVTVKKFKSLLQYYTQILINKQTGAYLGLRQQTGLNSNYVNLIGDESLNIVLDVEGTDWYGRPLLENLRTAYGNWNDVNDSASRYDNKIAGSHWIVYYPKGSTLYNGVETANYDIGVIILNNLQASSKLLVPRHVEQYVNELNENHKEEAWKIDLITADSQQTAFIERLKYLDALKVRGMGIPERAILEGQFGTKAESETQADFAIVIFEMRHNIITQAINGTPEIEGPINSLLVENWGEKARGTVYVSPVPIIKRDLQYFQQLYQSLLLDPDNAAIENQMIDFDTLRSKLDIPTKPLDNMNLKPLLDSYGAEETTDVEGDDEQIPM